MRGQESKRKINVNGQRLMQLLSTLSPSTSTNPFTSGDGGCAMALSAFSKQPNQTKHGLFRFQNSLQIPLCKKKISHHIKMPAYI
jgi:hypothetical protein